MMNDVGLGDKNIVKRGQKTKSAKTAVRLNMHRFEINYGQRYSSYIYSDLPHTLGQGRGGNLRRFKEQGGKQLMVEWGQNRRFL